MGCTGSKIQNGCLPNDFISISANNDLPIPADIFFYTEKLGKELENQFISNKIRIRKLKKQLKKNLNEMKQKHGEFENENLVNDKNWIDNKFYDDRIYDSGCSSSPSLVGNKKQPQQPLKYNSIKIPRSSSFIHDEICVHCEHNHLYNCCRYYYDTYEDAIDYATFKLNLEKPRDIQVQNIQGIPEALCGQFSPSNSPKWTFTNPKIIATLNRPNIEENKNRKFKDIFMQGLRGNFKNKNFDNYWKNKKDSIIRISNRLYDILMMIS